MSSKKQETGKNAEPDPIEGFIARHHTSADDLRDAIAFLIHRRELLRDCELEVLEHECARLTQEIEDKQRKILLEELDCFKEVLRLHKRLLKNDQPRD